jgi:hypothetical protein
MPLYYFILKEGIRGVPDLSGTELADDRAAHTYAKQLARELMRNRECKTAGWRIEICDADHRPLPGLEVLFALVDDTFADLPAETRDRIKRVRTTTSSLNDTIGDVRKSLLQLKGTLARAEKRPWLASTDGKALG